MLFINANYAIMIIVFLGGIIMLYMNSII